MNDFNMFLAALGNDKQLAKKLTKKIHENSNDLNNKEGLATKIVTLFALENGFNITENQIDSCLKQKLSMEDLEKIFGGANTFSKGIATLMGCLSVGTYIGGIVSNIHSESNSSSIDIYEKNQEFVNDLPTDEEGLKPYLKVNIDKHSNQDDPKHSKNISMEDYLRIKRTVISILSKCFRKNISEDEITNATTDEKLNQLLEQFSSYPKKKKAKAVYGWITENLSYSYEQLKSDTRHGTPTNATVTVFNNLCGICQGFSNLSKVMLRIAGVPCFYATSEDHAFNYICIEDEKSGDLVWRPMDTTSGSYKEITEDGKPTSERKRNDDFFPSTKELVEKTSNQHTELKMMTVKSKDDLGNTVNFYVCRDYKEEKVIRINLRDNLKDGLRTISIPKELQNLEGYTLFLPKGLNIKKLNLGESNFLQIGGPGKVQSVTFSDSSKNYSLKGNSIVNKFLGSVVFDPNMSINPGSRLNPYASSLDIDEIKIKNYKGKEKIFIDHKKKNIRIELGSSSDVSKYTIPEELKKFEGYTFEINP